jgi:hypothetical protein
MDFHHLADLLDEAIQDWYTSHNGAPIEPADISDLAVALAETLLYRTDLPIDPPSGELLADPSEQA